MGQIENGDLTASDDASSPIGSADVVKHGKWGWYAEDNSMVTLYRGDDPLMGAVLSIAPCGACQKRDADRLWGRCSMPKKEEADELLHILNSHESLIKCAEALKVAKQLCDNINEFGHVTDVQFHDAAESQIRAALSSLEESSK